MNDAPSAAGQDYWASLRLPEFRYLLLALAFSTFASRATVTVIGYQIYHHTDRALALGLLGLVEVIPAVSLALLGGHVADRYNRRRLVLITDAVSIVCALLFYLVSPHIDGLGIWPLYVIVFFAGIARGFGDPAANAFEAQVVPRALYVNASIWLSSMWQACSILGPASAGFAMYYLGIPHTYAVLGVLYTLAWICIWKIAPKPAPEVTPGESIYDSISAGIKFVMSQQELVGSMALDLFAVFFGGCLALLPIFAKDYLHVDERGLGFLNAAPGAGSLLVMLWCTWHPPARHAGKTFILCVTGFGVAMIVFALSTNFWLSLVALAASGAFDGVSVVIRKSILRILSPENMRGRISAVGSIFIASSNELGAFESGAAAAILGTVPSVVAGAGITLIIALATAVYAPRLWQLDLSYRPSRQE